jgi:hypothetical protein
MKIELNPMSALPSDRLRHNDRCGALTKTGQLCQQPKEAGRSRCHLHGGAPESGAPFGYKNGSYKDGAYTNEAKVERKWARGLTRQFGGEANSMIDTSRERACKVGVPAPARKRRRPMVAKVRKIDGNPRLFAVAPDGDVAGWRSRLKELFGTASPLFVEASLRQLIEASKLPGQGVGTTTSLTAALELIASLEPENEAQAALAVHVACLHTASLNVLSRTPSIGERNMIAMATACAKLEHAFHSAIETYYRVKRGVTQIVRVERVELQPGAQAVIGVVARE